MLFGMFARTHTQARNVSTRDDLLDVPISRFLSVASHLRISRFDELDMSRTQSRAGQSLRTYLADIRDEENLISCLRYSKRIYVCVGVKISRNILLHFLPTCRALFLRLCRPSLCFLLRSFFIHQRHFSRNSSLPQLSYARVDFCPSLSPRFERLRSTTTNQRATSITVMITAVFTATTTKRRCSSLLVCIHTLLAC